MRCPACRRDYPAHAKFCLEYGARVAFSGPPGAGATTLLREIVAALAERAQELGGGHTHRIALSEHESVERCRCDRALEDEAVREADVIMLLRIQLERMEGAFFPSLREYYNVFGMTEARMRLAKPDVMIMHPGPMNRGVEIASEVADGPYSVILDQVANGVAVRMAVLYLLAGGAEHETAA